MEHNLTNDDQAPTLQEYVDKLQQRRLEADPSQRLGPEEWGSHIELTLAAKKWGRPILVLQNTGDDRTWILNKFHPRQELDALHSYVVPGQWEQEILQNQTHTILLIHTNGDHFDGTICVTPKSGPDAIPKIEVPSPSILQHKIVAAKLAAHLEETKPEPSEDMEWIRTSSATTEGRGLRNTNEPTRYQSRSERHVAGRQPMDQRTRTGPSSMGHPRRTHKQCGRSP